MMQQIRYWPMCLVLGAGLGASIGFVLARQLPPQPIAAAVAVGVVLAAPLVWMMSRTLWRRLTMLDKPWADRHPALVAAVLAATAAGTGVALGGSSDALTAIWLRVLGLVVVSAMWASPPSPSPPWRGASSSSSAADSTSPDARDSSSSRATTSRTPPTSEPLGPRSTAHVALATPASIAATTWSSAGLICPAQSSSCGGTS